ncbi:hypothetical protein [Stappia sp. 28M-7]|uniref:hypothetical protein n=1 Tax=Stappia sp. 28M-7 TaxID=2762596 RepID=UPI000E770D07|nr:hypothetical protein [Stappia sp. 28M-7]MBC2861285.1 hypothetical protein [Stappia sp. 28M-7]
MSGKDPREEERRREAQSVLDRAERESETVLRTTFEGAHKRSGPPADEDDPIEQLGRKIGRSAGAVFALGLVVYLIWTYLISPA